MNGPVKPGSRPRQALQSYLDALLQEATEELPPSNDEHLPSLESEQAHAHAVADEFEAAVREEQARDAQQPGAAAKLPDIAIPAQAAARPAATGELQPARSEPRSPMPPRWAEPEPSVGSRLRMPVEAPLFELDEPALADFPSAPAAELAPAPALPDTELPPALPPVVEVHKAPSSTQVATPATDNLQGGAGSPPALGADGRPVWASESFECLLFDVAGLTLAVPLVCLGSIYSLAGQELTPLFGQPNWFLGILASQGGNLKVLDTARWVMPDRYRDDFQQGLQYVISVQGYEWGLAVHQVSRSLRLDPNEIKWRSQRGQRPWLAGTVIEHMCALLDVAALAELIASGGAKELEAAARLAAKAAAKPALAKLKR